MIGGKDKIKKDTPAEKKVVVKIPAMVKIPANYTNPEKTSGLRVEVREPKQMHDFELVD